MAAGASVLLSSVRVVASLSALLPSLRGFAVSAEAGEVLSFVAF